MPKYAYSPVAYQIAMQITGRPTQAIQNRYASIEERDSEWLSELKYESERYEQNFAGLWEYLTTAKFLNSYETDVLNVLHFIVGDSW